MKWRTPLLLFLVAAALAWVLIGDLGGADLGGGDDPTEPDSGPGVAQASGFEAAVVRGEAQTQVVPPSAAALRLALQPEADPLPVVYEFKDPPRAGLMFDVDTGEILWEHHPDRELPIASLTKMMTAHLIAARHQPDEKVMISRDAPRTGGSMIGVLPVGKKVPLGTLLKGLLLVSGNDAATALAEHDAGTVDRFVARMNDEADRIGLSCSHFTTPHGLEDEDNYSCPRDLAMLARADLANRRIAAIARTDHVDVPFPIKGGRLELYNNNPFIRAGDPTITGLKTGYTDAAGSCYVTTAERAGRQLGVILLNTPDPLVQIPKLLELGAAA
jgi:D-alanyl-D-alanine carboxypeptidase (penicillin-binding protein 5/6)